MYQEFDARMVYVPQKHSHIMLPDSVADWGGGGANSAGLVQIRSICQSARFFASRFMLRTQKIHNNYYLRGYCRSRGSLIASFPGSPLTPTPFLFFVGARESLGTRLGFTKFTQLHVVTSQFVMFISCALRARIEDGTGFCSGKLSLTALVLRVVVLYL